MENGWLKQWIEKKIQRDRMDDWWKNHEMDKRQPKVRSL